MTVFRNLIRTIISDGSVVVVFAPNKNPLYIPTHQSKRSDSKAIIEMPADGYKTIDQNSTDEEVEDIVAKISAPNALILFAHECGHHRAKNPGYDEALQRCLRLPVKDRVVADINLVLKEEREAWDIGFKELENLGFKIPASAYEMADKNVEEYRTGLTSAEPKFSWPT